MGSQKPILGGTKPDLVAVILEQSCAQQLALALAWALGSTGGGKTQTKGANYPAPAKEAVKGKKQAGKSPTPGAPKAQALGSPKAMAAFKAVGKSKSAAKKSGATKSGATKSGAKKSGGK